MRLFFCFFCFVFGILLLTPQALATDCSSQAILTEAMINPAALSDSEGEWLELFNPSSNQLNLKGFSLSSGQTTFTFVEDLSVNPNAPIVVCKNKEALQKINLPCSFEYEKLSLVNSGGQIALSWENTVCSLLNYSGSQIRDGVSLEFSFSSGLWSASTTPLGELEFGTPEKLSNSTEPTPPVTPSTPPATKQEPTSSDSTNPSPTTSPSATPGSSDQKQVSANLLLQAIFPNPAGSDSPEQEFIAIFNPNDFPVDLLGWALSNQNKDEFVFLNSLTIAPQKTLKIFAGFLGFSLRNSTETILLINPEEQLIGSLSFNESAPENKVLFKEPSGQLLWLDLSCLDGPCSLDPSSIQKAARINASFLELTIPQSFSPTKKDPKNNYESLKKEPDFSLVTLAGTVSSVESTLNQNGFYLELKNGSLLVKTAYAHSFKEKDRLIITGTLYKNNGRLFLKSDKDSQAQIIGQKNPTKHSLVKCLKQEDCSPKIASLVEFSGVISYAKSGRFLVQGEDRTEILLELPSRIDQALLGLREGLAVKTIGILEEDSPETQKIIVSHLSVLGVANPLHVPVATVATKKQTLSFGSSKNIAPPDQSLLLKNPASPEPVFLLQNPPAPETFFQSTPFAIKQFFINFLASVFNF